MSSGELLAIVLGCGGFTALVSGVIQIRLWRLNRKATKEDKSDDYNKHLVAGIRAILHDRIKQLGKKHIASGFISTEDLRDIDAMHECYHDLKGNGFLDVVIKQVKALPIKDQ